MSDWKYDLDEVGPDAEEAVEPLEPGSPSAENVAFVVLGALVTVLFFLRLTPVLAP